MTNLKRSMPMLVAVLMMVSVFAACGSNDDTKTDATQQTTTVETTAETVAETVAETTAETSTITEDEAIELVKQEMGEDFSYIPADELEEKDGSQYYVIYVKKLLEQGTMTTMATYFVKTDGSEVFDKDAASAHIGEYVNSGATGETTFTVAEDGTFEMTTVGEVNQTVIGTYGFGITDDANVIELKLYPTKTIIESDGEEIEEDAEIVEGTAVIENGTLTLSMESQETVFTKK